MHALLTRLAPALSVLLALAALSCDSEPESAVPSPDSSAIPTPPPSSVSAPISTVPATWNGAAIEIAPVAPSTASVRVTMDGGATRKTRITGGEQDETVSSPATDVVVDLAHNDQPYLVTPQRDVTGTPFADLDPGFPQDGPDERTFQFTDPDNGSVSRITVIIQDKEWPDDSSSIPR